MEQPAGLKKLLKDFDPRDLNRMPAAEVIKAFSLLRDAIKVLETIDESCSWPRYHGHEDAEKFLNRYKEWE